MGEVNYLEYELKLMTYAEPQPEEWPMFADSRVHQRSKGSPWPNRVVVSVDRKNKFERPYRCLQLSNQYIRVEILPELGGKIYSLCDLRSGYECFYKQHVIKPALIGLLGSWVSGGVEFNWPYHHRPSTFMPCDYSVENHPDGGKTVWLGEYEPMSRMKGMVGIHLDPDSVKVETRVKLFNCTPVRQSFLWWENAAVPVHDNYRIFFPQDVGYIQFHYRKNVTSYPVGRGVYNGIDFGDGTDLRELRNTPRGTSYFCGSTRHGFFGGYDALKRCGVVHVANPGTAVGKKLFTWGHCQLAKSWENALTDTDGAYAELMAGSFSNNQPDFTWIESCEEKVFTQNWIPVSLSGEPVYATENAVLSRENEKWQLIGVGQHRDVSIVCDGQCLKKTDIGPENLIEFQLPDDFSSLAVLDASHNVLLQYSTRNEEKAAPPKPLKDLPSLDAVKDADDAVLAGIHVEQFHDPITSGAPYFREALKQNPDHIGAHLGLAEYLYRHRFYKEARIHAEAAYRGLVRYNFQPLSGNCEYLLGLLCEETNDELSAEKHFQHASWAYDAAARSLTRLAMLEARRNNYPMMLNYSCEALRIFPANAAAIVLASIAEERMGNRDAAKARLAVLLRDDPLNYPARHFLQAWGGAAPSKVCELTDPREKLLDLAELYDSIGDAENAKKTRCEAYRLPGRTFPHRKGELADLAARNDAESKNALGSAFFAMGHYEECEVLFRQAYSADSGNPLFARNLAVLEYRLGNRQEALKLLLAAGDSPQAVWETSYVMSRMNLPASERIDYLLKHHADQNDIREDIALELASAYNENDNPDMALKVLLSRKFTPCEGGEHALAIQYMFAYFAKGLDAFAQKQPNNALKFFISAQNLPDSLGAGLWNDIMLIPAKFGQAEALALLGKKEDAQKIYHEIVAVQPDYFTNMHLPELPVWTALAWSRLGEAGQAYMQVLKFMEESQAMRGKRDPGWFKATPFFISYLEPAKLLRQAASDYRCALSLGAIGEVEKSITRMRAALAEEPAYVYGRSFIKHPEFFRLKTSR